jgi:manganese efflux pump family protein
MTEFLTYLMLAIGLSFDSFAVSVSCGIVKKEIRFDEAVRVAFSLGFFQALFPLIGWFIGHFLHGLLQNLDHWIAFGLLCIIGLRMIIEGIRKKEENLFYNPTKWSVLISMSVATSIDALAVGLSFGFLETNMLIPVIIIGVVTFFAAMLGMLFGKNISGEKSHRSIIVGGVILILIGVKILAGHFSEQGVFIGFLP